MQLSTKHLLGIRDLLASDIQTILDTATQFKEVLQRPIKKVPTLRDVTIVNLFYENSTRTRISFELAEKRLSADTINFTASGSSVSKGESLLDTVNNILSMIHNRRRRDTYIIGGLIGVCLFFLLRYVFW